eukprot:1154433-Pelagomonas_calceolata.AAC.1
MGIRRATGSSLCLTSTIGVKKSLLKSVSCASRFIFVAEQEEESPCPQEMADNGHTITTCFRWLLA